jgi:hypothetical protein
MEISDIPFILVQKIRMQRLVPIIRAMEDKFGRESVHAVLADEVTRGIEQARNSDEYKDRKADFARAEKGIEFFAAGEALKYEVLASDSDQLDFDVKNCQYARMMEELEATDLGFLLICQGDFAAAYESGMELTRTQTRMQGYDTCDFRYRQRTTGYRD